MLIGPVLPLVHLQGLMEACDGYVNLRRMKGGSLRPFLRPLSDEDTISL